MKQRTGSHKPKKLPYLDEAGQLAIPHTVINCRDRRLIKLFEEVFSSQMKIPSLKFALMLSYGGFLGVCLTGMATQALGLWQLSSAIQWLLLFWFLLLASILSPLLILSSESHQNLSYFFLPILITVVGLAGYRAFKYFSQPAYIALYSSGLSLVWKVGQAQVSTRVIRGEDIEHFYFAGSENANVEDWLAVATGGGKVLFQVKLGCLPDPDDRVSLLDWVQKTCRDVVVDPAILQAWTPVQSSSYTELWLQSLATPPKRARLAPLEAGMTLDNQQAAGRRRPGSRLPG